MSAKAFDIPKKLVWDAYLDVKKSGGGPGIDGQRMEDFERDLKNNLYKIWNRLSSGSYFPPPVLRVEIPKADGGVRALGIPMIHAYCISLPGRLGIAVAAQPRRTRYASSHSITDWQWQTKWIHAKQAARYSNNLQRLASDFMMAHYFQDR
jgi:hypothetical protein